MMMRTLLIVAAIIGFSAAALAQTGAEAAEEGRWHKWL
jgi:hypothetical protein